VGWNTAVEWSGGLQCIQQVVCKLEEMFTQPLPIEGSRQGLEQAVKV
jgi:hypothetical protein